MKLNFFAPLEGNLGYPIFARSLAKALENNGIDIRFLPIYGVGQWQAVDEQVRKMVNKVTRGSIDYNSVSVRMSIGSPAEMAFFSGKKRVGFTLLETSKIPQEWVSSLNQLDKIWNPSQWGKQMFIDSGVDADLVDVVPGGVDTEIFNPDVEPFENIETLGDVFKFLCVGKMENRKGQNILLQAFSEEFSEKENAVLIMQAFNPFIPNFNVFQYLYELNMPRIPTVLFLNRFIEDQKEFASIYTAVDTFVLPTRGEGWCLPVLEAMASGLPVIHSGVTSLTEFTNGKNSYILKNNGQIPVDDPQFFQHTQGSTWYDPDKDHLRELMRYVYDNQNEAKKKGKIAARDAKKWTWDNSAKIAIPLLEELDES